MSDDKILVDRIETSANGQVTISGIKSSTKEKFMLVCSAYDYCGASLINENNLNKSNKFIDLFKLTDIPNTMIIKGWTNASFINKKWLSEPALEMTSEEKGDWGNSNPALDYYNPNLFNHEWLSKFASYNLGLINLRGHLVTPNAQTQIINKLRNTNVISTHNFSKNPVLQGKSNYLYINDASSIKKFHREWQFQREKINEMGPTLLYHYVKNGIDDLWATFGACAIYAGIGDYTITKFYGSNLYEIKINSIICYVVDSYDFIVTEKEDDYLGHWSKTEFDFSTINKVGDKSNQIHSQKGLDLNTRIRPEQSIHYEKLLYPAFNHHYQAYRKKTGKGRDMVIWSKPYKIDMGNTDENLYTFTAKF